MVHFCKMIFNFGLVIKKEKLFKDISILALIAILFSRAEPFVHVL